MDTSTKEEGFTLIELLVVVIIIGILAAIAIPVFLNQRDSAMVAAAESDVRNAAIAVETYYTVNSTYPADDAAFQVLVASGDVQVTSDITLTFTPVAGTYVIAADHAGTPAAVDAQWDSGAGGLQ